MLVRMQRKKEPLYTIGGNVNSSSYYRNQYRGSSKTKIGTAI
jgi:hypothetical protein